VRRGDAEAARSARAIVLEAVGRSHVGGEGEHALRAAIAAAREVGELDEVGRALYEANPRMGSAIADERARAGAIEGDLAMQVRLAPGDPRAGQWAADFEESVTRQEEFLEEGLTEERTVHDARLDLAAMMAALGRRERASEILARVSGGLAASFDAEDRTSRAHLEAVRAGASPVPPPDAAWLGPDGARAVEAALEKWKTAPDGRRFRNRAERAKVLAAVAALGHHGQLDRARELYARLEAVVDPATSYVDGALVAAWVALGALDRAVRYADARWLLPDAATPLVAGLVAAGRRPEALAILGRTLAEVDRADLRELAPAILAVADDPRACAERMLASWQRGDAARASLLC
jgi:hypothetical protein